MIDSRLRSSVKNVDIARRDKGSILICRFLKTVEKFLRLKKEISGDLSQVSIKKQSIYKFVNSP